MTTHEHDGLLDGEDRRIEVDLVGDDTGIQGYARGTFVKLGTAMATLCACVLATYLVPALYWARPWTTTDTEHDCLRGDRDDPVPFWNLIGRELLGEGEAAAAQEEQAEATAELAQHVLAEEDRDAPAIVDKEIITPASANELPPYAPHPDDTELPTQPIDLPSPTTLDRFLARLARTDAGYEGAVTRVVHWGDSVVAADHISSAVRAKLQQRFGDAGHGFHLLARPNASFMHKAIEFRGGEDWSRCYIINKCKSDGLYGLGGTTVWSSGGAETTFRTADSTPNGRKVGKLELWYLADPKGGDIRVRIDRGEPTTVSTREDAAADRWHTITMDDGPHELEIRAAGGGKVRLYGAVMERDVPGVVWDGMAQLGAFTSRMLYFDATHIRDQVAHRDAALLVFMFGGNDLLLSENRLDEYRETFREMLQRFRAQPEPPDCLVMSPVDHGVREGQRVVSNPMVDKIAAIQREVAFEQGCGFFDTKAAMGGDGSVARWRRSNPPLISGDLAHLTDPGQKVLGHMLYVAILQRYVEYRRRKG